MSMSRKVAQEPSSQTSSVKDGSTFAAAFHYTEPIRTVQSTPRAATSNNQQSGMSGLSPRRRAAQAAAMNGYVASPDLPPPPAPIYVRALYNYDADDHTSLSFRQGDIIQVLTQLESGWWDGVINDVRGWFPSNYTVEVSTHQEMGDLDTFQGSHDESETTGSGTEEDYDEEEEEEEDSDAHTQDDDSDLPIEGGNTQIQEEAAFWVPQATPDGRLFYFNTLTGVSTMELPLETPTSADETGPRDRNHFHVPDQTRPPPEMLGGGYGQDEEDYDGSESEADAEQSFISSHKKGSATSGSMSTSTSMDSIDVSAARQAGNQLPTFLTSAFGSQANMSVALPPLGTTATSFTVAPKPTLSHSPAPRYFLEDTTATPLSWNALVENMRTAVEAYRHAIHTRARADYVRRAEDISDHLRLLLAAGSGTTDNHSGNPSIISSNKALYPHFREMMSKFSKLVLSSHIAAADWPGPDALAKCLQEADGVMNGVYGYVDVARQQRGEEIPRLIPGFFMGCNVGGSWRDNHVESHANLDEVSFMDSGDEIRSRPSVPLDGNLLLRIEDSKKNLTAALRHLEESLLLSEKTVTPARQSVIGDSACQRGVVVIDHFRPWMSHIESINLSPLGNVYQKSSLVDYATQKQKAYDSIGELVACCQAVTAPLPDEWAELRGESLETRLSNVRAACKQLDTHVSNVGYALQLLLPAASLSVPTTSKRDHRMTDGGETYQNHHLRSDSAHASNLRPALADVGQSKSYTLGQDAAVEKARRPPTKDKARQFFGQIPPNLTKLKTTSIEPSFAGDEVPWYLQLDHPDEVKWDTRNEPQQVKSGTLTGLVEQLTRHDRPDTTFTTIFLLTYRSFTTASELFELLVKRFNLQPPAGLNRDEYLIWEEHKQKTARFRVLNILKAWLELYWMENDDATSKELLERILAFAKSTSTSTKIPLAKVLINIVDQRMKGGETSSKKLVFTLTNSAPPPILPKNIKKLKFLDIDPIEFARQLTIIESKLYGKIKPVECLAKTWEKKGKSDNHDTAPNVQALILHSNQLTNWVAEMILAQGDMKKRVAVIKHFVSIADRCRGLNNFSAVTAVISAMGTAPILRLNRTWHAANMKTRAMVESMRQLISSTKNFVQYRETLHAATPPCIPFLGVYLTDLIFIEDGIASLVKNTELINFAKRTKTAEVIRDIQQYQNVPYSLNPVPELQEWISENMRNAGDVQEMYNQSLKLEPREREDEKITRLLTESGFL